MVKTTVYLPLDLKLRIEQVANARQCSRARGEIWHGEAQLQDLTPIPGAHEPAGKFGTAKRNCKT